MLYRSILFVPLLLLAIHTSQPFAAADPRKFAFTYEASTEDQGDIDVETSITWKHHRGPRRVDEFDVRHELEWGATDRLTLGIYAVNWGSSGNRVGF